MSRDEQAPKLVFLQFADSHAGRHIRKWSQEPFEDGAPYCRGLPTVGSPQEAWDIAHRDGAYNERSEIETRFWSIVDREGLSGLPSDMWTALEILVTRYRAPVAGQASTITEALRGASGGGKPFSRDDENGGVADAAAEDGALLPCPFCGNQPRTCPDTSYGAATVFCSDDNDCPVHPVADADLKSGQSIADAIVAWNTRAPDQFAENAKSSGEVDGWHPIETAPYQTVVRVRAGDMTFLARLEPNASMTRDEVSCDQWQAAVDGEHPPCWSGGACWESNEDEMCSLQPTGWKPVEPAVALARSGKGEG